MKTLEITANLDEEIDFRSVRLDSGDGCTRKGQIEIVKEAVYENERLVLLRTVRRSNDGIIETGYNIDKGTGKIAQASSGIFFGKDAPPFHASSKYSALDKFLATFER
jgi:hypothetical protein